MDSGLSIRRVVDLTLCALALACFYVGHERTFYWWDYALYADIASQITDAFRASWSSGLQAVAERTGRDHSALFALPLVPVRLALGESRLVFIGSLTLFYLVPLAMALGRLASRLIPDAGSHTFWVTCSIALATPAFWVPTLRGFPDAGAELLVILALLCHFGGNHWRRSLAAGALLGLAVLFRRHFLLVLPVFAATATASLLTDRRLGTLAVRVKTAAWRLGVCGAGLAIVILALGFGFARRIATHDFYDLYSAYLNPTSLTASWFADQYGWLCLVLAVTGYALGLGYGILDRRWAVTILVFAGLSFLLWILIVRQLGEPYTVHFTPVVVLGLAALERAACLLPPRHRRAAGIAAGLCLAWNLVAGLGAQPITKAYPHLLAGNWPPLYREDYDELKGLAAFLRERTAGQQPIALVASSFLLNPSILRAADREVRPAGAPQLEILRMPAIESRDRYPLGALLQAGYVVVATPLQLHLDPAEQRVVRAAWEVFANPGRFAADFEPVQSNFELLDESVIRIFQRLRPTPPEVGLATLRQMEASVGRWPGTQPEWELISSRFRFWRSAHDAGETELVAHPDHRDAVAPTRALYLRPESRQPRVSGTLKFVDDRCQGVALVFGGLAANGALREVAEVTFEPAGNPQFAATVTLDEGEDLGLAITIPRGQESIDNCLVSLNPLKVSR